MLLLVWCPYTTTKKHSCSDMLIIIMVKGVHIQMCLFLMCYDDMENTTLVSHSFNGMGKLSWSNIWNIGLFMCNTTLQPAHVFMCSVFTWSSHYLSGIWYNKYEFKGVFSDIIDRNVIASGEMYSCQIKIFSFLTLIYYQKIVYSNDNDLFLYRCRYTIWAAVKYSYNIYGLLNWLP